MELRHQYRLLDPERLVWIRRRLSNPDETTVESVPYWLALAIAAEAPTEPRTRSLRILELEDI